MTTAKLKLAKSLSAQTQQSTSWVVLRNAASGAGTRTSPPLPAGELHWDSPALGESPSLEVFVPWPRQSHGQPGLLLATALQEPGPETSGSPFPPAFLNL